MNLQEAIEQGYEHYVHPSDGFQGAKSLTDLRDHPNQHDWDREIELIEKNPYHPSGMSGGDILELIGDQLQANHSDDSGDDTDGVADAIKDIDLAIVQPLVQAINEKLAGLNYYRGTGIILTRE